MRTILLTLVFTAFTATFIHADSWPEFRGPTGEGFAPDSAKVPTRWSGTKNVRWKVPVAGKAWSSPIVIDGKIYVTTAEESGTDDLKLSTLCFDLKSGKELWVTENFSAKSVRMHKRNSQASPTPIFEDGKVYVHFGHYGTACLNAADGKEIWKQTSLSYDPVHGNGGSPIIVGDHLIFSCDGKKEPFIAALKTSDGSIAWKTDRGVETKRPFSFSTPLAIEIDGKTQVISPASGAVLAYNPVTGKEIWRFLYGEGYSVVARPVFSNGLIFVGSGFNKAVLYAIRPGGKGDVTESHLAWKYEESVPRESSFIVVDDLLYMNDDKGTLTCLDAKSGEQYYQERISGKGGYSASPLYASGNIYFHNGGGVTTVVKPGKKFRQVAENDIDEFGLSTFAIVDDGFIVRTEGNLLRIGK